MELRPEPSLAESLFKVDSAENGSEFLNYFSCNGIGTSWGRIGINMKFWWCRMLLLLSDEVAQVKSRLGVWFWLSPTWSSKYRKMAKNFLSFLLAGVLGSMKRCICVEKLHRCWRMLLLRSDKDSQLANPNAVRNRVPEIKGGGFFLSSHRSQKWVKRQKFLLYARVRVPMVFRLSETKSIGEEGEIFLSPWVAPNSGKRPKIFFYTRVRVQMERCLSETMLIGVVGEIFLSPWGAQNSVKRPKFPLYARVRVQMVSAVRD